MFVGSQKVNPTSSAHTALLPAHKHKHASCSPMLISCPCVIDPLPLLGTACLLATAESLMHTYHALPLPQSIRPDALLRHGLGVRCVSFRLADPPHSSPSSILHDLIAGLGWMDGDDDDDRNVGSNMEGWVWTEQHMRHFDLYSHCQLTSHTWMGDGCAVMCCLPTYLSLSVHRILVVLARACVSCCEVQGSLRPIVPSIPS
jgi:hypothetical protein